MLHDEDHRIVSRLQNCADILMNFLVAHVTKLPPIKVSQRRNLRSNQIASIDSFIEKQYCINVFTHTFGYMPLRKSSIRMDPVLFKDPVSIQRKKYRQLERIP